MKLKIGFETDFLFSFPFFFFILFHFFFIKISKAGRVFGGFKNPARRAQGKAA